MKVLPIYIAAGINGFEKTDSIEFGIESSNNAHCTALISTRYALL
ncbi:hypothetical protein [Shewanella surugensis]|nr:hypothetical protein [Shewanella surugensis]